MHSAFRVGFLSLGLIVHACTPSQTSSPDVSSAQHDAHADETHPHIYDGWYHGGAEEAFKEARRQNKPLFLYWGAVWCPPCNEIKNEVFTKPEFADLMKRVIPVYLDGDLEAAQIWGDKLSVSGYPTLLVLDKDGKEILRIAEFVNIQEFKESFLAAMRANRPIEETLKKVLAGKGDEMDWSVLAYFNWDEKKDLKMTPKALLDARKKLADTAPANLKEERAILSGRVLEAAAELSKDDETRATTKSSLEKVRKDFPKYFAALTSDDKNIIAARATLLYGGKDILAFAYPDENTIAAKTARSHWVSAVQKIRTMPTSTDTHLMSYYAEVDLATGKDSKANISDAFRKEIVAEVEKADERAQGYYRRHATISGAGDLLTAIGEEEKAKELLEKELKTTDTPWYYQAQLSQICEKMGNKEEALKYSEDARKSAKGSATKLQWITNDLLTRARLNAGEEKVYEVLNEYYDAAFHATDGFSGRSQARAMRIAKEMKKFMSNAKIRNLVTTYSRSCSNNKDPGKSGCVKHFAELAKAPAAS